MHLIHRLLFYLDLGVGVNTRYRYVFDMSMFKKLFYIFSYIWRIVSVHTHL